MPILCEWFNSHKYCVFMGKEAKLKNMQYILNHTIKIESKETGKNQCKMHENTFTWYK